MRIIAEASPALDENPKRIPVDIGGGQIVVADIPDAEYIQIRYGTVTHEGVDYAIFDPIGDVWIVDGGAFDGCHFSDLIIARDSS